MTVDSDTDRQSAWLVGIDESADGVVSFVRPARFPCDGSSFSLAYSHWAVGDQALLSEMEAATVLFVAPGVVAWNGLSEMPLSQRAELEFRRHPHLLIVAAVLTPGQCWAQLRHHDPVLLTQQQADSGMDPRLLASLLYLRSTTRYPAARALRLHDVETVRHDDQIIQVRISTPDPEPTPAHVPDTRAPQPATPVRQRHSASLSWQAACAHARDLLPEAAGHLALWPLLAYATSLETGQPALTLAQVRYRLGESQYRCRTWLYSQLHHAGHHVESSPEPPRPASACEAGHLSALTHLALLGDKDNPQRDDPVVRAWRRLTTPMADIHSAEDGSDGLTWPATYSWREVLDHEWPHMVTLVDHQLTVDRGAFPSGTPIRTREPNRHGRTHAIIEEPQWVFDHDRRSITPGHPDSYRVAYCSPRVHGHEPDVTPLNITQFTIDDRGHTDHNEL